MGYFFFPLRSVHLGAGVMSWGKKKKKKGVTASGEKDKKMLQTFLLAGEVEVGILSNTTPKTKQIKTKMMGKKKRHFKYNIVYFTIDPLLTDFMFLIPFFGHLLSFSQCLSVWRLALVLSERELILLNHCKLDTFTAVCTIFISVCSKLISTSVRLEQSTSFLKHSKCPLV